MLTDIKNSEVDTEPLTPDPWEVAAINESIIIDTDTQIINLQKIETPYSDLFKRFPPIIETCVQQISVTKRILDSAIQQFDGEMTLKELGAFVLKLESQITNLNNIAEYCMLASLEARKRIFSVPSTYLEDSDALNVLTSYQLKPSTFNISSHMDNYYSRQPLLNYSQRNIIEMEINNWRSFFGIPSVNEKRWVLIKN